MSENSVPEFEEPVRRQFFNFADPSIGATAAQAFWDWQSSQRRTLSPLRINSAGTMEVSFIGDDLEDQELFARFCELNFPDAYSVFDEEQIDPDRL